MLLVPGIWSFDVKKKQNKTIFLIASYDPRWFLLGIVFFVQLHFNLYFLKVSTRSKEEKDTFSLLY